MKVSRLGTALSSRKFIPFPVCLGKRYQTRAHTIRVVWFPACVEEGIQTAELVFWLLVTGAMAY